MKRALILLALAVTTPAVAQNPMGEPAPGGIATNRMLWEDVTNYLVKSAEQMSEANYAFKPTPEVRTFGEIIGHLAGSQHMYCALALGEKAPAEDEVEKSAKSKADLIASLKASNDHCRQAYALAESAGAKMVDVFGQSRSVLYTLMANTSHDNEHYGNLVTYMRMKGMVPPSSQPSR
jgi:uncharacterized damage-inducible protein DinB